MATVGLLQRCAVHQLRSPCRNSCVCLVELAAIAWIAPYSPCAPCHYAPYTIPRPCYLRAAKLQEDQDVQLQAVGQLASEHELRAEGLGSRIDSLRGTQVGETETRDSGPSNCTTIANYNAL